MVDSGVSTAQSAAGSFPALSGSRVSIFHYIDATEPIAEPFLSQHQERWEKTNLSDPSERIVVELARRQSSIPKKIIAGTVIATVPMLGIASGFLSPNGISGIVTSLGSLALFPSLAHASYSFFESALKQWSHRSAPAWKGVKRFLISGADKTMTEIRASSPEMKPAMRLENFLNTMKDYGANVNVVVISGHGLGYHRLAGMKVRDAAKAFENSEQTTGKKPHLLVLESCLMGNLESLWHLRNAAKYAVVSKEVLTDLLPIQDVAKEAGGLSPKDLALKLVEKSKEKKGFRELTVVDLEAFPDFIGSLDRLGASLSKKMVEDPGIGKEVHKAIGKSPKFPRMLPMYLERGVLGFRDIGAFLENLKANIPDPAIKRQVNETLSSLHASVYAAPSTPEKHKTDSGVSAQITGKMGRFLTRVFLNRKSDSYPQICPGWNKFLDEL